MKYSEYIGKKQLETMTELNDNPMITPRILTNSNQLLYTFCDNYDKIWPKRYFKIHMMKVT